MRDPSIEKSPDLWTILRLRECPRSAMSLAWIVSQTIRPGPSSRQVGKSGPACRPTRAVRPAGQGRQGRQARAVRLSGRQARIGRAVKAGPAGRQGRAGRAVRPASQGRQGRQPQTGRPAGRHRRAVKPAGQGRQAGRRPSVGLKPGRDRQTGRENAFPLSWRRRRPRQPQNGARPGRVGDLHEADPVCRRQTDLSTKGGEETLLKLVATTSWIRFQAVRGEDVESTAWKVEGASKFSSICSHSESSQNSKTRLNKGNRLKGREEGKLQPSSVEKSKN